VLPLPCVLFPHPPAEAGQSIKAIEAAIQSRQFAKAAGIIDYLDHDKVRH
jgi:hypothetical protein